MIRFATWGEFFRFWISIGLLTAWVYFAPTLLSQVVDVGKQIALLFK